MKYKSKEQNDFKKKMEPTGTEVPEHGMLFANQKELWVCNGSTINIYNPVSGSLIEVKEKHRDKIISLCRVSDVNEEEYEILSCDEEGFVCHWCIEGHKNYDKSFYLPISKNYKLTHFTYGDKYFMATLTGEGSSVSNLVYIKNNSKNLKSIHLTNGVKIGQYKVALSYDRKYVAAIKEEALFLRDISDVHNRNGTFRIELHCVAFHPTKYIIATGSMNGRITLWYQFTETYPTKVYLHWHTLPAQTICFSSTGGDLYSGGKESVLVRWYLTDDNRRSFLPRLGMPIQSVQCDPSSTYVALLHIDDSISIISSKEMRLEGTLQRLTKHVSVLGEGNDPSNKILLYHEPSSSFIKTGKTGYLQFFNPLLSKINYDLDITMTNYVTDERSKKLPNVEITCAAISEDGVWLSTVEMCHLTISLKEIVLKFWHYSLKKQCWELNTTIHTPHLDTITAFTFCPVMEQTIPTCISCSEDGKFKVWKLVTFTDLKGLERNIWNNQTSRDFRDLPATACAFSQDTSLLAVAFNSIVTLWCPEEFLLKRILTQCFLTERITDIIFSHERWKGSALVTRSENYICTWDLLSCTLLWRVYIRSSCLVKDPHTGLLAVFSNSNDVYFFDPPSSEPISSSHNIGSDVICAVFAPYINPAKGETERKATSTLFYYDKNQIHNLSFSGLVEHFDSFLPSVCLISDNKTKDKLKYETLDEEMRNREEKKNAIDSYDVEENRRIEKIQNYDFNTLLNIL
ncbi:WD repeat-containing protein 75 [Armadillidium nasatum]|uniref:WD repeat-containing protein 75 n=1 Tax=Armadillidium nasatum TaxID=96803 RepID=A0A5N5TE19_9CRUS|nr:WD repeat-containing protein 75 [Armadillidium nasatum]